MLPMRDKQPTITEDRATQPMEAGGWVSQFYETEWWSQKAYSVQSIKKVFAANIWILVWLEDSPIKWFSLLIQTYWQENAEACNFLQSTKTNHRGVPQKYCSAKVNCWSIQHFCSSSKNTSKLHELFLPGCKLNWVVACSPLLPETI